MGISKVIVPLMVVLSWTPASFLVQNDNPSDYTYPESYSLCERPWRPVLKLADDGSVVNGSLKEMRELAMGGHMFRIKLYQTDTPYVLNVDNTNVRGDHVCAESLWHVSDNGTHVSTSVEWLYRLICTDGRHEVVVSPYSRPEGWQAPVGSYSAREDDARKNFGTVQNSTEAMLWYVKEVGTGTPVYSHFLDGTHAGGSLSGLMRMAQLGETHGVMRDRGYSVTMNNVWVDPDSQEINAQSINHVGQRFVSDGLSMHQTPYYWYSSWSVDGRRDNARYFVGTMQSRGHNNDFVAMDWHVDPCWREVYVHDDMGQRVRGSLEQLIMMISLGHRVRLQIDKVVLEATSLRISENMVIAQCLEELGRRGTPGPYKFFFNSHTTWVWTLAHTNGKVRIYKYGVRDAAFYGQEIKWTAIRWMVDTRPWQRVHSWPLQESLGDNSLDVLINAVQRGASIRFSLQQDLSAGFFFTNADNVRYDPVRNNVYAQCLRIISDMKDQANANEYEIQSRPFHWFLMISADGVMAMSAWKIKERDQLYDSIAPEANITWFALY